MEYGNYCRQQMFSSLLTAIAVTCAGIIIYVCIWFAVASTESVTSDTQHAVSSSRDQNKGFTKDLSAGCTLPYPCYNWMTETSCTMGTAAQPDNDGSVLNACSDVPAGRVWFRGMPYYKYQFDIKTASVDNITMQRDIVAISQCTTTNYFMPALYNDSMAVLRSVALNPASCSVFRLRFWYCLYSVPYFAASSPSVDEYNLKVFIEQDGSLVSQEFPTQLLWGSAADYTHFSGVREWHLVEVVFGRQAGQRFTVNFFAFHKDGCRSDTIANQIYVDDVEIERAVHSSPENGTCWTTTAATTTSTPSSTATTASPDEITVTVFLLEELRNATNRTLYDSDYGYYVQSPQNVLNATQNLLIGSHTEVNFSNIQIISEFFLHFAEMPIPNGLPNSAQEATVNMMLEIVDVIIIAEENKKVIPPDSREDGPHAAAAVYQALEILYNNLPPKEQPYIFNTTRVVTFANALAVNSTAQFANLNIYTEMNVQRFENGLLSVDVSGEKAAVARIALNKDVLREAYEKFQRNPNGTFTFSFSLSAMPVFRFGKHPTQNSRQEFASPLVLLAAVNRQLTLKGTNVIQIEHNIDKLFKEAHGARRRHGCTFLGYTSKKWSTNGCRMSSKLPSWKGTIVQCTCDHLTPFSLLLTLCSSISQIPTTQTFSLDLAVVTTSTAVVAALCCFFALVVIAFRICRRQIVFDEDTFARTSLWIVLFAMYLFVTFSQLMLFAPDLCGPTSCFATAVLVHWFSLMSAAWTGVETFRLLQMIRYPERYARKTFSIPGDTYNGFRMKAWLGATFIPLLFPFIASASHHSVEASRILGGYGYASHEKWCWLDGDHPWITWVTFIAPVSAVALLNICAVLYYLCRKRALINGIAKADGHGSIKPERLIELRSNLSGHTFARNHFHGVIVTTALMGLIWLSVWLALFSCFIDETVQHAFVLLLTLTCGSQAVYIISFQAIAPRKRLTGRKPSRVGGIAHILEAPTHAGQPVP
ncbi:uncharacterized protein LOC129590752 [Paramacrobiotus metropolitanus]|uniref:uncharacterized protein LOC129590752 n=1 Tax=Paramacrobiotus metropolitanus TaxID=2943436 RepID=UPI0024464656|nr:uncharacterized protein LOC129590752 [Paramacrobiotus metropolitanus]